MKRPFRQVDVFTAVPYRGNPLAVVLDGRGLSTDAMLHFTEWTNLSEATFLSPPSTADADYRVRIFCPGRELPFAGHPTLGSCHAWLEAGGTPRREEIVQECGAGLVRIRRDGTRLAFVAPPLVKSGPLDEAEVRLIARGLGIEREDIVHHAWCDNGPRWRGVMLRSAEEVRALRPDPSILARLDVGVVGPRSESKNPTQRSVDSANTEFDDAIAFEVRAFFPGNNGITEDPVTGSLNAALGQWLIGAGLAPERYVVSQGQALGRAGRVYVERDERGQVWVGGDSVTCVSGEVQL